MITALFAGVMLFATMGSASAEELPVMDGTVYESCTEGTIETMAMPVYPTSYPEGFNMYETVASVDADGCLEMLNLLNAERESIGVAPLQLDANLTMSAMYRASEIGLVYRHKDPAGGWGQSEYRKKGSGTENIAIGRASGAGAYYAFETSAAHYIQMTQSICTRVGVGNFGNAW
ncbi:MAG: CAP domain-containing protein, partial [Dysgonomonas sp.]